VIAPQLFEPRLLPRFAAPALPAVIGHRGAAACAPENTLAGLRAAAALGCTWVEFDVRLSGDGVPLLCHDPALDRTTDGTGKVSARSLAAIRELDAGGWFAPAFAGERVAMLEEALRLCAELGLGADLELKADRGREYPLAKAVAATLAGLRGRIGPVLVSSFQPLALWTLRDEPQMARGVLFRVVPRDWAEIAARLGCAVIGADHRRLRRRRVAEIRDAGWQLAAYTVNDPARARLLFRWGVTSVFSDAPDIIAKSGAGPGLALARQGAIRCSRSIRW
jgi:glycerophosphoryl diester phosphodiesterase